MMHNKYYCPVTIGLFADDVNHKKKNNKIKKKIYRINADSVVYYHGNSRSFETFVSALRVGLAFGIFTFITGSMVERQTFAVIALWEVDFVCQAQSSQTD